MKAPKLSTQVLLAIALAALVGVSFRADAAFYGVSLSSALGFLGELFLRSLKMLVVPLVASSILVSVLELGGERDLGRVGAKTLSYYAVTSICATVIGVLLVDWVRPGIVDGKPARELIGLEADPRAALAQIEGRDASDVVGVFVRMIPENPLAAAANTDMLGLIVFCILFGYFGTKVSEAARDTQLSFWRSVQEIWIKVTDFVLAFAPLGVFGLVGKVVLTTGWSAVVPLVTFTLTVIVGLFLHVALVLSPALFWGAHVLPHRFFRAMSPALGLAFSTASSSGTLPVTIESLRKTGISERIVGFTMPLGATINMDGTALYECVAAVFIAQAYGVDLSAGKLILVLFVALLTSIGVAGIPAASLVAISVILSALGLPLEGIGLLLAVDRVLDMCRTAVNVLSDASGAMVIARTEGERFLPELMRSDA